MTKIFISYSHDDEALADRLAKLLRESFDNVWYDEKLHGGEVWWQEIVTQVRGCDAFIFLLSPESLKSEYCLKELAEARSLSKTIIPVKVRRSTEIPTDFQPIQIIEMLGEIKVEGLNKIYASLTKSSTTLNHEKIIDHYLLFWWRGMNDWGKADWLHAVDWVSRYRQTCGFQLHEAMRARKVTIIGSPHGIDETAEQALKSAGCEIERLDGMTAEDTAELLRKRAVESIRFEGGSKKQGY